MFTALQTLLATLAGITVSIVANADRTLTVCVIPKAKKEGGDAALNTPLNLTGTAEELDAEFANILTSYTNKRTSLSEQLAATEAILEASQKEATSKATKAVKKGGAKASETPAKPAGDDEDEHQDDDDVVGSCTPAASVAIEAKPAAAADDNLFA